MASTKPYKTLFTLSARSEVIQFSPFFAHPGAISKDDAQSCDPRSMPYKTIEVLFRISGPSSLTAFVRSVEIVALSETVEEENYIFRLFERMVGYQGMFSFKTIF